MTSSAHLLSGAQTFPDENKSVTEFIRAILSLPLVGVNSETVLFVIDLGPDCYKDSTRFPSGPWCKKGDFILVRPNAGTRLVIHGREFRIINDDSVEGVVDDPRGIKRK